MAIDNNSDFKPEPLVERQLQPHDSGSAVWPPQPDPYRASPAAPTAEVTSCPHCNRKLLSKRSILCNWCGKRIDDAEYLERAAQERALEDARLRDQVEKELQETAKMGIIGRLTRRKKELKREPNLLIPPPDL